MRKRHLLAAKRDARGEDPVLELVVALDELVRDQAALAGLPQAVEPLALVARRAGLGLAQRVELAPAEEVVVARDDRRLLGGLLLPHPHRARLLGALEHVLAEPVLELDGAANDCDGHGSTLAHGHNVLPRQLDELGGLERLRDDRVRAALVHGHIDGPAHEHDRDPGGA